MSRISAIIFFLIVLTNSAHTSIYGTDDRTLSFYQDKYKKYTQAVLSQVRKDGYNETKDRVWLETKPLHDHVKNLCMETRFSEIETFSRCTAFLVAEDLIVTAGHCINSQEQCDNTTWVFSSHLDPLDINKNLVKDDVVKCDTLINRRKNQISKNDYALIRINKKIKNREPLKFRTSGKIQNDESLIVFGHPTGLPLMNSGSADILNNDSLFLFKINSDTFGGNSGSPVVNLRTGLVEGILTDGDLDYTMNKKAGCLLPHRCTDTSCKGENVVRITNIPELVPGMTPEEPLFDLRKNKRPRL